MRFPGFEGEWEEIRLADITEKVNSGKTPLGGESVYLSTGIVFIRSQNVNNNKLSLENSVYISEEVNATMKNSIVNPNDILLNITGASLGRSCVVPEDFELGNVNQHVCIIRLKENFNPRFIQPIFSSSKGQSVFESLQTGSGREGLNFDSIKKIKLKLPKVDEQQKIASFLSLLNKRIETQNKIIRELETSLKSISHDLFSKKIRFVGTAGKPFPNWQLKKLEQVFLSEKGKGISKSQVVQNGNYKCVLYGELYTTYKEVINEVYSSTDKLDGTKSKIGDLLIPCSTTTSGIDLANVTALNKSNILIGGDITILRSKLEVNNVFYAYYLSNYKNDEMASYAQGSTIVHLYYSHFKDMYIDLPCFEEQTRIANFLVLINSKIEVESQLLKKYEKHKEYLLRNLFT